MNLYSLDPVGCPACALGDAGAGDGKPWMQTGECEKYLNLVEIYTRLSNKENKSKSTREGAAKYAAGNQILYNQCMEQKAQSAVQTIVQQQAAGTTPVAASVPGESWLSANKALLIGGGVVVVALIAYLILRKK